MLVSILHHVNLIKSIHEKIELTSKTAESKDKIYNWSTEIEAILTKPNLYSSLAAEDKYKAYKLGNVENIAV